MKNNLQSVTRNLRNLIKTLPAIQANCSAEVLSRHLQLIAHFQRQYDQLIAAAQPAPSAG